MNTQTNEQLPTKPDLRYRVKANAGTRLLPLTLEFVVEAVSLSEALVEARRKLQREGFPFARTDKITKL